MKFLAFLRDSYREAVSGWVLQVMLVLSLIFLILVASISFSPVTLEEDLKPKIESLTFQSIFQQNTGNPRYSVENIKKTSQETEAWKGNYQFDIVIRCQSAEDLEMAKNNSRVATSRNKLEEFLSNEKVLGYLKNIQIAEAVEEQNTVPANEPGEKLKNNDEPEAKVKPKFDTLRFVVTSQGTNIDDQLSWMHNAAIFFGGVDIPVIMSLREWVFNLQSTLINDIGSWIIVLMSVLVTAGFIPSIMTKGAVDLVISKPVGRLELLLYKYIGGLLFVMILISFLTGGAWFVVGVRYNFWTINFLGMIPILTFYFAILYSISTLIGVLTRSTVVAILVTLLAWGGFTLVGWGNRVYEEGIERVEKLTKDFEKMDDALPNEQKELIPKEQALEAAKPSTVTTVAHYIHYFTPRTYNLDKRANRLVARGILTEFELKKRDFDKELGESWIETLGGAGVFIVMMLLLGYWRFATRDG